MLRTNNICNCFDDSISVEFLVAAHWRANGVLHHSLRLAWFPAICKWISKDTTDLFRRPSRVKMGVENFFCEGFKVNTQCLSDGSHRCHSLNPTTSFLFRVGLGIGAKLVDHLHRLYGFIKTYENHCNSLVWMLCAGIVSKTVDAPQGISNMTPWNWRGFFASGFKPSTSFLICVSMSSSLELDSPSSSPPPRVVSSMLYRHVSGEFKI